MKASLLLVFLSLCGAAKVFAAPYQLRLSLPLYDSTGTTVSEFSPSLWQSHALTQDFYLGAHWALANAFDSSTDSNGHPLEIFGLIAFDYVSGYLPLGLSWLHEEGHRAVLNQYGIRSHNGVYDARIGDGDIPVDRVRDRDLIQLKRDHPADFVRLSTAGMEAESQMALNLEKAQFFDQALPRQRFLLLLAHLGPIGYRTFCDSRAADAATAEDLATEGPDEMQRDFTGYDCVSYVYDLYRPFEPYESRGPHPSGSGISRYRSRDDLSRSEKVHLRRMATYSFLNLVDPFLFDFAGWTWGEYLWAATLRHQLAPFGQSLEENLFLRRSEEKHLLIFRQYSNQWKTLPGIDWQCFNCWNGQDGLAMDLRTAIWWQPRDLLFASRSWMPGGLVTLRFKQDWGDQYRLFAELMAKTVGWVADEIDLGAAARFRLGIDWRLD